jgi:arabinofuranosyltransferase
MDKKNNLINKIKEKKFFIQFLGITTSFMLIIWRTFQYNRPDILIDDSYISFRYANNLISGFGLVFNPGERVEGYTNFLWVLIIAAGKFCGLDPITTSKIINLLSALGTILLILLIAKKLLIHFPNATLIAIFPLILFSATGSQARYIVSGMETLLFTFFLLLAIYLFYFTNFYFFSGIVFALCTMTRPEGLMYFLIGIILSILIIHKDQNINKYQFYITKQNLLLMISGFVILFLPYYLWRYLYYGYPFPNTYYVKAAGFRPIRLFRGIQLLKQILSKWPFFPILTIGSLTLLSLKRNYIWLVFISFILATMGYFIYIGGDFIVWFGPRIILPVFPFMLLIFSNGLGKMIDLLPLHSDTIKQILITILTILITVYTFRYSWPGLGAGLDVFTTQMRGWKELGLWINKYTPPDIKIATDAAGLIPYYSKRYSIDMFGLADLHLAHQDFNHLGTGIVAHEKYNPEYILERRPDCIISTWMDPEGHAVSAGLDTKIKEFELNYQLVAVAKIREGPPDDHRWIIPTSIYKEGLYKRGYQSGIFCLKK